MRRVTTRAAAAAAVVVLGLGAAACGDDDDDDATLTEAEASGDPAAFCDALLEFNGAVFAVELDEDAPEADVVAAGEQLAPLFDDMDENAPPEVADATSELNDSAIQPLLDGEAEAFNSDSTFEAYTALVEDSAPVCDFQEVGVTAVDYAFSGVPETIEAGQYSFQLTNESEAEEHEMILFRKADGVTMSIEELVNLPEEDSQELVVFSGAAFAPPGASGSTLTELEPGEYGMVCFIPVGGGEDGPPHFTEGMLAEFTVE